jgi:hypothetical protein
VKRVIRVVQAPQLVAGAVRLAEHGDKEVPAAAVERGRPFPVDVVADEVEQGYGLGRGGKIQNRGSLCRAGPRVLSAPRIPKR